MLARLFCAVTLCVTSALPAWAADAATTPAAVSRSPKLPQTLRAALDRSTAVAKRSDFDGWVAAGVRSLEASLMTSGATPAEADAALLGITSSLRAERDAVAIVRRKLTLALNVCGQGPQQARDRPKIKAAAAHQKLALAAVRTSGQNAPDDECGLSVAAFNAFSAPAAPPAFDTGGGGFFSDLAGDYRPAATQ